MILQSRGVGLTCDMVYRQGMSMERGTPYRRRKQTLSRSIPSARTHYRGLRPLQWIVVALCASHFAAAGEIKPGVIPAAQQENLAGRFAPVLIYHPGEDYFPCTPPDVATMNTPNPSQRAQERIQAYKSLSLQEKMARATVYYQVYSADKGRIIIEYWMYYIHNAYRAGGGLLRFYSDFSHPNDLRILSAFLVEGAVLRRVLRALEVELDL